jgi:hypothetical protein
MRKARANKERIQKLRDFYTRCYQRKHGGDYQELRLKFEEMAVEVLCEKVENIFGLIQESKDAQLI